MIVFDTETTGLLKHEAAPLHEQPRIIDIACIKISDVDGSELARFETLLNPQRDIELIITKITGYTNEQLRKAPTFADVLPNLAHFFLGQASMLAHNMPFDKGMMFYELLHVDSATKFPWPMQQFCTVQMYMDDFGRRPKMTELYERKTGNILDQRHTAMADAEALLEIVRVDKLWLLSQGVSQIDSIQHLTGTPRQRAAGKVLASIKKEVRAKRPTPAQVTLGANGLPTLPNKGKR